MGLLGLGMAFMDHHLCIDCLAERGDCGLDHAAQASRVTVAEARGRAVPGSRPLIKYALASGLPIAAGIAVAPSWLDLASVVTGTARVPTLSEPLVDGDVVVLTGWDDETSTFTCLYTAGSCWGHDGLGAIPYDYILNRQLCFELVTLPDDLSD
jgi:hypothetical protein